MHTTQTFAELDDELATAETPTRALTVVVLALRAAQRVVGRWSDEPGAAGCLCRIVDELGRARAIVAEALTAGAEVVVPLPAGDLSKVPIASVARLLGRTAKVLSLLAREGLPETTRTGSEPLPPAARRACAAAWAIVFRSLVRLRVEEETVTWSSAARVPVERPARTAVGVPPPARTGARAASPSPAGLG